MTTWDKIYRDYQNGGEAWATLSQGIHPMFKQFVNKSKFQVKCAFDIGCGTGKYAHYLLNHSFKVDGLDSSPTAVKMTKQLLGPQAGDFKTANMYKFKLTPNKYDLVISVAAIHHGQKKDIANLINKIYEAIRAKGKIFITLPNHNNIKKWDTFKKHKNVAEGTYAPLAGPEKGLAHSFYTKKEIEKLFSQFIKLKLTLDSQGRWIIRATK